ncbi:MAG TPA: DUF3175 domain-containing protein [Steroidobacteraceae bacterium]|jgi:hypothetical protein
MKKAATHTPRRATRRTRWSAAVGRSSNALDLKPGIFTQRSARAIAASLKRSALASHRRKSEPFRSAMSMLSYQINRGGRGLTRERRRTLERAKDELRRLFHRRAPSRARR